jgi:hypothetical protein
MGAPLDRVGAKQTIQTQAFSDSAEQGEEHHGDRKDKHEAIAASRIFETNVEGSKTEARIFFVAKVFFDRESLAVKRDDTVRDSG